MPRVRTPDGRVLNFPEGTPPETVQSVLQEQFPEAFQAAPPPGPGVAPPPTPPGAGLPGPPSPAPGAPAIGVPGPAAAPPAPAPAAPEGEPTPYTHPELFPNPTAGMNDYELAAAGMGQSVESNARGLKQMGHQALASGMFPLYKMLLGGGEQADIDKLQQEEANARQTDEALLETGAGRGGQIGGHVLQAAIPGGGAARLAATAGRALPAVMAAEGLAGGGMSAAAPTVKGESRGLNTAKGALISALIPGGTRTLKVISGMPKTITGAAIRAILPRGTKGLADVAVRMRDQGTKGLSRVEKRAWEEINEVSSKAKVEIGEPMVRALRGIKSNYGKSMPEGVNDTIDKIISFGSVKGAKPVLPGVKLQETRAALGADAAELGGSAKLGIKKVQQILDDATDSVLSKADKRRLKEARDAYHTGRAPVQNFSGGRLTTRAVIQALRAPYGPPPAIE